mmetsp:Transcript_98780/g.288137  ORF Transcript_98780/g.288137 Transcript_98780/m.288137 type:complete len:253 (-) Transcript_98780:1184-1942(-)
MSSSSCGAVKVLAASMVSGLSSSSSGLTFGSSAGVVVPAADPAGLDSRSSACSLSMPASSTDSRLSAGLRLFFGGSHALSPLACDGLRVGGLRAPAFGSEELVEMPSNAATRLVGRPGSAESITESPMARATSPERASSRWNTRSSRVPSTTRKCTSTSAAFWPSLCTRASACSMTPGTAGQSSQKTQSEAAVSVRPSPAASTASTATRHEGSAWKRRTRPRRSATGVEPSMRMQSTSRLFSVFSRASSMEM